MQLISDFFRKENLNSPEIGILDIGAMLLDGQNKEYQSLVDAGVAQVIGFEPVEQECEKLNEKFQGKNIRFLPYFIGDGSQQTFCLNNHSMTSSLYEANTNLLELFQNLAELTITENREQVQTTRLDDVFEIDIPVDFIKIDVQGAELQAFEGARKMLKNATVIQTEVEWVPLYKNQPLFSEVELCLREQGYLVHKIQGFGTRSFKPYVFNNNVNIGMQQLWSDVIFVKNFTELGKLSERQLCVYVVLMHEIYHAFDLCGHILSELGRRASRPLADAYRSWLGVGENS